MYRIGKFALALSLCVGAVAKPAMAHHSFAMFDKDKLTELKGVTVVEYAWGNPHVYIVVKSGETKYTMECGSIATLTEAGWKFSTLKGGDKIDIVFYPLRSGKPGGALKTATLGDGRQLEG